MIPKICHLIWTEGVPMSYLQSLTVKSFRRHNPGWDIMLHLITGKRAPNMCADYAGEDYSDTINPDEVFYYQSTGLHGIQQSDRLRMKILYLWGGVYSDLDMLWLRPMSEFPQDFETTVCWYKDHYNMSNIVSESGGPFLKDVMERQARVTSKDYQAYLTEMFNREYPDVNALQKRFPRILAIPYEWFYPYSIYTLEQLYVDDIDLTAGAYGVHWFNGHHLSQEYLRQPKPCSMSSILRREGYIDSSLQWMTSPA